MLDVVDKIIFPNIFSSTQKLWYKMDSGPIDLSNTAPFSEVITDFQKRFMQFRT